MSSLCESHRYQADLEKEKAAIEKEIAKERKDRERRADNWRVERGRRGSYSPL